MSKETAKEAARSAGEAQGLTEFSRLFVHWLSSHNVVLGISSLGERGLMLIGLDAKTSPSFGVFDYPDLRGIASAPDGTLWVAQRLGLWKLENGARTGGYTFEHNDVYLPRLQHMTGDLGLTDMAVDGHGALLLASSRFSLVGKVCGEASIEPVWRPPFISKVLAENRCGLSGLALFDAERHCVSLYSRSDQPGGWKNGCLDSGLVMTIQGGKVLCEGLSLPLAPRWGQGNLFLLNSGTAEFGRIDSESKRFVPLCQCPSYPTSLTLHGHWAVIAVSEEPPDVPGLPASENFASRGIKPYAGVLLVDTRTGDIAHNVRFENYPKHLTGVAVVPRTRAAVALGPLDPKLAPLVTFRKAGPRR